MAALVQSFPQQSSTVTMLQTRPSSDPFQTGGPTAQQLRNSGMARHIYNGGNMTTTYRGQSSQAPVAPYAFTTTPILGNPSNPLRQHPTTPHLRSENRAFSAPAIALTQPNTINPVTQTRQRQLATVPVNVLGPEHDATTTNHLKATKDDVVIPVPRTTTTAPRPLSAIELNLSEPKMSAASTQSKPSPDRYRRNHRRAETSQPAIVSPNSGSAMPSGSGMANVNHLYNPPAQNSVPHRTSQIFNNQDNSPALAPSPRIVSKDDMTLSRQASSDLAKRYRRRSISSLEAGEFTDQLLETREIGPLPQISVFSAPHKPERQDLRPIQTIQRPISSHTRNASDESAKTNSRPSSSKRDSGATTAINPAPLHGVPITKHEVKLVNVPARGSSDANKRLTAPSPLSKPMAVGVDRPQSQKPFTNSKQGKAPQPQAPPPATSTPQSDSPAAQQLAALNKKEAKKDGKSSRLRRAFSFGSAAELRKASAENSHNNNVSDRARLRKERYQDEQEAEQAAIAQKQEAAGLGEGIYSGQGRFFTGSTDNLSVSSTASSASVMLRKMGKGVKKSTRSLVGLFRPKSVIGVPAADAAVPEISTAQVSMVTVEAEREKVNVNVDPHDQAGGGTAFPKLERNSVDAASMGTNEPALSFSDRSSNDARARPSIVGGEKERAEVLAAVKKGILKRNATYDSTTFPLATKSADPKNSTDTTPTLPQLPRFGDSPTSSTPSTPKDDHPNRHRRTDSVTIEGEDYFMSIARFANSETKSLPGTPKSIAARNITFNSQIQFHDTWTGLEYDRRGEIATCNRLTPMLAQQIKEELNSFKMEMEVHADSKRFTHFF